VVRVVASRSAVLTHGRAALIHVEYRSTSLREIALRRFDWTSSMGQVSGVTKTAQRGLGTPTPSESSKMLA